MAVRQPIWIRRVAAPGAEAFAVLYALESFSRAILTSILPLQALALLGEPQSVSLVFFLGSLAGLVGSMSLGLQYLLLDKGADTLIEQILRLTDAKLTTG